MYEGTNNYYYLTVTVGGVRSLLTLETACPLPYHRKVITYIRWLLKGSDRQARVDFIRENRLASKGQRFYST